MYTQVLPATLSEALEREFEKRCGVRDAPPPTEQQKIALLRELLAPPPPAEIPPELRTQARNVYLSRTGRLPASHHETLLLLNSLLQPHVDAAMGVVDVVECAAELIDAGGGGGVRIRPPTLKTVSGTSQVSGPPAPSSSSHFRPSTLPWVLTSVQVRSCFATLLID